MAATEAGEARGFEKAFEEVATLLDDKAGRAYAMRQDDKAEKYRMTANEVRELSPSKPNDDDLWSKRQQAWSDVTALVRGEEP